MELTVDLIWDTEYEQPDDLALDSYLEALGKELNISGGELAVRVVDDCVMKQVNAQFRNKDTVTDVLSFPSGIDANQEEIPHLGDILICWQQLLRQAEELVQSPQVEFRFLVLHGLLHLLGHDHETDSGEMMAIQGQLKNKLALFFEC